MAVFALKSDKNYELIIKIVDTFFLVPSIIAAFIQILNRRFELNSFIHIVYRFKEIIYNIDVIHKMEKVITKVKIKVFCCCNKQLFIVLINNL